MIPKTQYLDALIRKKSVSLFVSETLAGKTVSAAINLDREFCGHAEEIEKVSAAGMLAAEFKSSKMAASEQAP